MKKILLFLGLIFSGSVLAQNHLEHVNNVSENERRRHELRRNIQINPNTTNYDVTHQKLEFTVNPAQYFISGKVTTTFKAKENMTHVFFDLADQLEVSSVKQNGVSLDFTHENEQLNITLDNTISLGNSGIVEVVYSGNPPMQNQAFTTGTHNGTPILYTLSEPFGSKDWWPCKHDLNDKIDSLDVYITAPSQYVSVSNGMEISATVSGNQKTTHFRHQYPIAAYLVAIAVTNYSVFEQQAGTAPNEFPIINYVYPENYNAARANLNQTVDIMNFLEEKFGTYPFSDEKYGHAQFGFGGGMEHQTISFMGGFSTDLIVHELAHHWFGNLVTCGTWKDIWLNEGFSSYAEGLYTEYNQGLNAFVNWKNYNIDYICSQPGGNLYLTDSQAENSDRIFSGRISYTKGGMVVHMLRWVMGDEAFYQGLQNYLTDPALAYGYATTAQLKTHLEAASGKSLQEFFNDWIYNQGYPSYQLNGQHLSQGIYRVRLNQTQSHNSVNFFEMPVQVRFIGTGNQRKDVVLDHTSNGQIFDIEVPFTVTQVRVDPERHIIAMDNTVNLGTNNSPELIGASIYPNPAKNQLTISLPDRFSMKSAEITNVLGQRVKSVGSGQTVDVSELQSGVHFITIYTESGQRAFKFIKE